ENLRRLAERIVHSRQARENADLLADKLLSSAQHSASFAVASLERSIETPLDPSFIVQIVQRLRDLDPKIRPVLLWLDQRLAEAGTTADEVVRVEHQQQGAT